MNKVSVDWRDSLKKFRTLTKTTEKDVQKEVRKAIVKTAEEILKDVKRYSPVRSGALRSAWRLRRRGSGIKRSYIIENNKNYASFIENGTRFITPRRMLAKALAKGEKNLKRRLSIIEKKMSRKFNK